MAEQINKTQEQRRIISGRMFLLCMSGLLINIIFAHLARIMALPLYLDNIGSALAAALGGYIPGIIVGFLTNLINGIWDYSSIYYGSLTILIAMASAWFAGKKYYSFQKPWRLLAVIAVFALIGGGLGSVLTWFLYGFSFASGISAPLALRLFSGGIANKFLAQLSADLLVDLADKGITVFIVALSFSVLPASLRESLYSAGWQQTPLSRERRNAARKKRARIASLRLKLIALVISGVVITAAALATISFAHFNVSARQEQENLANFHHEKWNGTGYPRGLKGEEIPLSARIMAVADVFDALVSRRSYKEPFSFEKAMQIIREDSGLRFDPAIVDAFCRAGEEVRRIMDSIQGS